MIAWQDPIPSLEGGSPEGTRSPKPRGSSRLVVILLTFGFCLEAPFAGIREWIPIGGPDSGPIRRLVQDPGIPSTVYAIGGRGRGGIWKSSNKGRDWTSLSRGEEDNTASDLQVDPHDSAVLFKSTEDNGVYRSDDGGLTWRDINPDQGNRRFTIIRIHPNRPDLLYAVSEGSYTPGIRMSPDGGNSWSPPGLRLVVRAIALDLEDPHLLYAGTVGGALFRTLDAGQSWGQIAFLSGGSINTLAVDPTDSSRILAGTDGGIRISRNAGNTWSGAGMEGLSIRVVRFSTRDPSRLFAATDSGVFSSDDDGETWTSLGLDRSIWDLLIDSEEDEYLLAATDRGVFRRETEEEPWMASNHKLDTAPVMSFAWDPNNPDKIYAGSTGFISRTSNGGMTWASTHLTGEDGTPVKEVSVVAPDPLEPERLYAGTPSGVFRSCNGGVDWKPANAGLPRLQVRDLRADPAQPGFVYVTLGESSHDGWAPRSTGGVFRSQDGGESWVLAGFEDQYSSCLAFDAQGHIYVVSGGYGEFGSGPGQIGLWKSQNRGRSWVRLDAGDQVLPACSSLFVHQDRPEVLYIGGHSGFFRSEDGGTSWQTKDRGLGYPHHPPFVFSLALHPADPETIYAGTKTGVYESRNGGWQWFPIGDGISAFEVECVGVHPRETDLIYSCLPQGGLWEYQTISPVREDLRYSTFGPLLRNTPDEFSGTALLNLDEASTSVQITAYATDGQPLTGTQITNPVTLEIGPGEQRALLAEEIWGQGLIGAVHRGWIRVDASSPQLWGLLAIGKRNLSSLDGIKFDSSGTNGFVFPELIADASTLLQIVNPNAQQTVQVDLTVWTKDGHRRASKRLSKLPPLGAVSGSLYDIFGNIPLEDSDYIWGSSTHHLLPSLLIQGEDGDAALVPHFDFRGGIHTLYAAQVAIGPGIATEISLVNSALGADNWAKVRVRSFESSGAQIGPFREFFIPDFGKLLLNAEELFEYSGGLFSGYLEVWSSIPLRGTVRFRGTGNSRFLAVLPLAGDPENEQLFAHLASGKSSFMGLCILNPGEKSTQVHLEAFGTDGTLLAERCLELGPRRQVSQLISEYFPELAGQEIAGGYVRLRSDQGVHASALFAPWDLSSLMAVPSQTLRTITY